MNFGEGYQSLDYKTGSSYGGGGGYGGGFGGGGGGDFRGGGGGFMAGGGGGFASPGGNVLSPGGSGEKRKQKNQSVRPLTSSQLYSASLPKSDEPFNIDNEEVGQVVVVGEIIEVIDMPTSITYRIDDRMGPLMEVRKWISDDEDSQLELQRRYACREGIYVKVVGHLRVFNKQRSVIAFCIRPIEDFNEVTHHLAECIYAHVALTKGLPMPKQFTELQTEQAGGSGSFLAGGGGTSSWAPMATSTQIGGASYDTRMDSGLTGVQKKVLSVIGQSKTEHGLHVNEVVSIVKNHGISDNSIKTALDFLCNEGHIYSTIDDEHFKSTEDF